MNISFVSLTCTGASTAHGPPLNCSSASGSSLLYSNPGKGGEGGVRERE